MIDEHINCFEVDLVMNGIGVVVFRVAGGGMIVQESESERLQLGMVFVLEKVVLRFVFIQRLGC